MHVVLTSEMGPPVRLWLLLSRRSFMVALKEIQDCIRLTWQDFGSAALVTSSSLGIRGHCHNTFNIQNANRAFRISNSLRVQCFQEDNFLKPRRKIVRPYLYMKVWMGIRSFRWIYFKIRKLHPQEKGAVLVGKTNLGLIRKWMWVFLSIWK